MKINAENGELLLKNSHGDIIIIPKNKRQEVLGHLSKSNYKAIDDIAESLPYMDDYAEDGTLVPTDLLSKTDPPDNPPIKKSVTIGETMNPTYMLYKSIADSENYEATGERKSSNDEVNVIKDRYKNIYGDKVPIEELGNIATKSKKRADVLYKLNTLAGKKELEFNNADVTKQIEGSDSHYKKSHGKTDYDFYNVDSEDVAFKNTPLNRDIYNKIVKAADNIGMDRYTALGLGLVESNFGKGYKDKTSGTLYESNIFSNVDGKAWKTNKNFDMNKGKTSAVLDYVSSKGIDISSLDDASIEKYVQGFQEDTKDIHPIAKTGIEAALTYYKNNPSGYNSGNKKYVQTVNYAADTLRKQKDKLEAWEKTK